MNRSVFFHQVALGTIGAAVLQKQALASLIRPEPHWNIFYTGCYTATPQEGIPVCRFDSQSGDIQFVESCGGVNNPSFLIFSHDRNFVYAVNETADFGGKNSGSVSAFGRSDKTGRLVFLNSRPTLGANPCHLTLDRTGKFILVANYTGGNVAVIPVEPDGRLGEPVDMVQHAGKGPNAARQEGPHAHSVNLSPDNRFAFVCDLGLDKIMIYRFDSKTGKLTPSDTPFFRTAPGAGPRHFTFTQDGRNAFVVNELNSTITSLKYDPAKGILTEIQSVSTLPAGFSGENTCADVHIHPSGLFVYASNRGSDTIAVFDIEQSTFRLKLHQNQSTKGKTPRNFAIHPSGKYLLAANQNSNSIHAFSIDPGTGQLTATGKFVQINKPVCILL